MGHHEGGSVTESYRRYTPRPFLGRWRDETFDTQKSPLVCAVHHHVNSSLGDQYGATPMVMRDKQLPFKAFVRPPNAYVAIVVRADDRGSVWAEDARTDGLTAFLREHVRLFACC